MPTITELTIYPIKSCGGIALQQARLNESGLSYQDVHDREWMVVNLQGQFLSQREYPLLARLQPSISDTTLCVRAADIPPLELPLARQEQGGPVTVQVWDDRVAAHDCGDAAAAWFTNAIGSACRLVRFASDAQRFTSGKWTAGKPVATRFADGYPMLLTSVASLNDLNRRLLAQGRTAVPMNRFRPNIVLDGIEAFEEDYAASFEIGADIRLQPVKPCPRCPIPGVDQATGMVGPNPVDILQSYRANPLVDGGITFGMNTILTSGAGQLLQVGAQVSMQLAF